VSRLDGFARLAFALTRQTKTTDPTPPPIKPDQEWANAWTHGIATVIAIVMGVVLIRQASITSTGMAIACGAYVASMVGTFFCSTLSHVIMRQPMLNTLRSWDQAMIYTMISGTYTPMVFGYATESVRTPLLIAIWVAAGAGFLMKVAMRHRVNSIGTVSYLALGWLPAIPLIGQVPAALIGWMIVGGVLYTAGVVLLVNDHRVRYVHAGWHLFVMSAAACHGWAIWRYVL
jgi:hemolysin III